MSKSRWSALWRSTLWGTFAIILLCVSVPIIVVLGFLLYQVPESARILCKAPERL